jgi:2-dehydropantoate 2-reductase
MDPMMTQRILIEGVGGVGGVVAGGLLRVGLAPVLVTGNPDITRTIEDRGLLVRTPRGEERFHAQVHTRLEDVPGEAPFDAAYLIMKAAAVVESARDTVPLLEPDAGFVVTFQNGIVEDDVAAAIGAHRVVSAIVGWGATMHAPGDVERTSEGALHIGEIDGPIGPRVQRLAGTLEAVSPVVASGNIRGALWSKLAINCMITSGGAVTGETLGEMLHDESVRRTFLGIYREVVDTAEACGIQLERIAANPKLLYLPVDAGALHRGLKDVFVRFIGRRYGALKSSSLQSLERGRKTEVDFLNGYVVARADEAGVPVPLNRALVAMIKEIEAGERPLTPDNVGDLMRAGGMT